MIRWVMQLYNGDCAVPFPLNFIPFSIFFLPPLEAASSISSSGERQHEKSVAATNMNITSEERNTSLLSTKEFSTPSTSEDVIGSSDGKGDTPAPVEDTTTYPSGLKFAVILAALMVSNFLVALDTTIISTAIPVISRDFHTLQDVGWYVSSYLLTNCSFQLLYGKLYTLFAVKPIFVAAMVIFEIGSLLCAVAPSSTVFILGRAIAGLGSAGAFSGGKFLMAFPLFPEGIDR